MAKKTKVNKAAAIRDYAKDNPKAGPTETAKVLSDKGIAVTPQQVSTTLANERKKLGIKVKRRGRKPAAGKVGTSKPNAVGLEDLVKAKELVDQLGSIAKAKAALDALTRIVG